MRLTAALLLVGLSFSTQRWMPEIMAARSICACCDMLSSNHVRMAPSTRGDTRFPARLAASKEPDNTGESRGKTLRLDRRELPQRKTPRGESHGDAAHSRRWGDDQSRRQARALHRYTAHTARLGRRRSLRGDDRHAVVRGTSSPSLATVRL